MKQIMVTIYNPVTMRNTYICNRVECDVGCGFSLKMATAPQVVQESRPYMAETNTYIVYTYGLK